MTGGNATSGNATSGNAAAEIVTETESLSSAGENGCLPYCEIISE
jgi:hypothetical protein